MEGDLGRLVRGFAERHELGVNEAAKSLIALAVVTLDCRYYGLVSQLADTLGGSNPFVQACLRVNASLEGAAVATSRPFIPEQERPDLVLRVVESVLAGQGRTANTEGLWFLSGASGTTNAAADEQVAESESAGDEEKIDMTKRKKKTYRRVED
jgi:hypothetical protein